jgi:hypothetical protein
VVAKLCYEILKKVSNSCWLYFDNMRL